MAPDSTDVRDLRRPVLAARSGGQLPAMRALRSPLMSMGPSLEDMQRRRTLRQRLASASLMVALVAASAAWVTLGGAAGPPAPEVAPRTVPLADIQTGKPEPLTLATDDEERLRLQLPIARDAITAIGYDTLEGADAVPLVPRGSTAGGGWLEGLRRRFLATEPETGIRYVTLSSGTPDVVLVGATAGADVYAPIAGTIVAIAPNRIDGNTYGAAIHIQPLGDVETVLVIRNVDASPELAVGMTVSEGLTFLGDVVATDEAYDQPLAEFTHDAGNHVGLHASRVAGSPFI